VNYYERHIGDYLKDTAHLSLLEHGVYTRLLDVYYTRESALPDDQVARLIGARSRDEKEALQAVLGEFFIKTDAGWNQDRCDREIARYQEKQAKARNSANARWGAKPPQSDGNADVSANGMRTHSEGNAPNPQTPDTSTHGSPSLRSGDAAPAKPARARREPKSEITLAAYLDACKAEKRKAVPDDHHIRTWAADAGIADEMLQVAWLTFRDRHVPQPGDKKPAKKQKDWPLTFANCVKDNWYRLWFIDGTEVKWTSQGQIQLKAYEAQIARHNAQNPGDQPT
jgi:uncharacterized protein YdaU (DUF1376 family)